MLLKAYLPMNDSDRSILSSTCGTTLSKTDSQRSASGHFDITPKVTGTLTSPSLDTSWKSSDKGLCPGQKPGKCSMKRAYVVDAASTEVASNSEQSIEDKKYPSKAIVKASCRKLLQ